MKPSRIQIACYFGISCLAALSSGVLQAADAVSSPTLTPKATEAVVPQAPSGLAVPPATVTTQPTNESTTAASTPALSSADQHPYSQMFTVEAGAFHPTSISVSNSNSSYAYNGSSLNSYLVEPGWNIKLFHLLGAVSLQESVAFSMFKANLPNSGDSISLFMLGIDTRLRHSWEWFPVRAIIPFVEGGYQFTVVSQSGPSDFESADAWTGNFVAAAGIDLWINALFTGPVDAVNKYNAIPVFLTGKVNYIAPGTNGLNLGSTSVLAGISIGI